MIRYLIDTNIASYFLQRRFPDLHEKMQAEMRAGSLALSAISRAELRYGQQLMQPEDRRRRLIDRFLLEIPILEWSADAADRYGDLAAAQKRQGQPIGTMDTLIAAHALAADLTLVTHNVKHFERIAGLRLEDWA